MQVLGLEHLARLGDERVAGCRRRSERHRTDAGLRRVHDARDRRGRARATTASRRAPPRRARRGTASATSSRRLFMTLPRERPSVIASASACSPGVGAHAGAVGRFVSVAHSSVTPGALTPSSDCVRRSRTPARDPAPRSRTTSRALPRARVCGAWRVATSRQGVSPARRPASRRTRRPGVDDRARERGDWKPSKCSDTTTSARARFAISARGRGERAVVGAREHRRARRGARLDGDATRQVERERLLDRAVGLHVNCRRRRARDRARRRASRADRRALGRERLQRRAGARRARASRGRAACRDASRSPLARPRTRT